MTISAAWLQNVSYSATLDRMWGEMLGVEPGVRKPRAFKMTATGSGLQMSVLGGHALVRGSTVTNQGVYVVLSDATELITPGAAPGTGSRIDLLILEVLDGQVTGAGSGASVNKGQLRIVAGTPATTPAVPTTPASSVVLAQVTIPAGTTTLTSANITDKRTMGGPGPHVGDIKPWPTAGIFPAGWLLCDGATVSRTTYAELFELVGTRFGVGDGSTTFKLPDLRGRAVIGMDDMGTGAASVMLSAQADSIGGVGGTETVAVTVNELPSHGHVMTHTHAVTTTIASAGDHNHGFSYAGSAGFLFNRQDLGAGTISYVISPTTSSGTTATAGAHTHTATSTVTGFSGNTGNTGGGAPLRNDQPWIAFPILIKAT